MKLSHIFLSAALACGLMACESTGTGPNGPKGSLRVNPYKDGKTLALYVVSTKKGTVRKRVRNKKNRLVWVNEKQDTQLNADGKTYFTTGRVIGLDDVSYALAAKTINDEPALGLRLTPDAALRLATELQSSKGGTVLASIDNKFFSRLNNAGAKLEDGVILFPVSSLVDARDLAVTLRDGKKGK